MRAARARLIGGGGADHAAPEDDTMLASRMNLVTLREDPADAEIASHRLLVRGGYLHKSGAGLYLYGPLMQRTLNKVRAIVADEMARAGALEVTMPIMQEQALWERSGRWATYQASRTMLTVKDRNDQVFGLAPTAEEVVTDYAGTVVSSYKQLPVTFFQQHTKFRDEIRPRFGLMRVKEFIMMDAYSFHDSTESLDETYRAMRVAYLRAFGRLGLEAVAVEADSGAIGGSGSHEFMVAAAVGEDTIVYNNQSGYGANVERAQGVIPAAPAWPDAPATATLVHTPAVGAIEDVMRFLVANGHPSAAAAHGLKCVLFIVGTASANHPVAAFVRGDREVNEVKFTNTVTRALGERGPVLALRAMTPDEVRAATGAEPGFAGPGAGLKVTVAVADPTLEGRPLIAGANRTDHHLVGFVLGRDAIPGLVIDDITRITVGDACPRSGLPLSEQRGIEVGHIFKLGTKYSAAMKAEFMAKDGTRQPFVMGCYGIGSSRVVAAAVEQHHDADGIRWPMAIAPYQAVVVPAGKPGDTAVESAAKGIYDGLLAQGVEVILDDRDAKPGVKFKDWDLVGIPLRIVVGKALAEGNVEFKPRGGEVRLVPVAEAVAVVAGAVNEQLSASLARAAAVR
jgi:prolyl-tRNA synthetase